MGINRRFQRLIEERKTEFHGVSLPFNKKALPLPAGR
jgi:hypothetical protein